MSHLWDRAWHDATDSSDVLQNIGRKWTDIGFKNLGNDDFARLEPFLEPFDAVYNEEEITILSRLGSNGIQKEFCKVFTNESGNYVLEWYLQEHDYRRIYLQDVALFLFGPTYQHNDARCITMLTYALSSLRKLKIVIHETSVHGEEDNSLASLEDGSLEDASLEEFSE